MLIGIVGFIGSGKDTVGDYLKDEYSFRMDSFAKPLKDSVSIIFGWNRDMLEGNTKESRDWREQVDEYWSKVCKKEITPRFALQLFGTECIRNVFHEDVWASSLIIRYMNNDEKNTVITDCRFPNEAQAIQKVGGKVWRVKRGPDPDWVQDYINLVKGYNLGEIERLRHEGYFPHVSETALVGYEFNAVIENNGTLNDLYDKVDVLTSAYNS